MEFTLTVTVERTSGKFVSLDALDPTTLRNLIRDEVEAVRDQDRWDDAVARQDEARRQLQELADETRSRWEEDDDDE